MRPRSARTASIGPARLVLAAALAAGAALWSCGSPSSTPTFAPASAATPALTPAPPSTGAGPTVSGLVSTLRSAAGNRFIGSAVGLPQLHTDLEYAAILGPQFNSVTPENAMKWGSVEPARGQKDFSGADEIVAFAQAHGQKVRGHALVWHTQLPAWLTGGTFTKAQLGDILKNHIALEAGRYAGKVYAWDVVNEPIADDGKLRDDIWTQGLGPEYIADAFRWARAADPAAKLYINDYDIEGINPRATPSTTS